MTWQGSDAETACPCESWAGTQLEKSRSFANAKEDWARLCLKEKQESEHDSVKMSPDQHVPRSPHAGCLCLSREGLYDRHG